MAEWSLLAMPIGLGKHVVLEDFAELHHAGMDHPLMTEIETALAATR